ncbi:MAG TPA: hypothetical protein VE641_09775 [Chthoniobacterales bacterium]|nr:hypothetical protein [Chthoniobacterales bacterium]
MANWLRRSFGAGVYRFLGLRSNSFPKKLKIGDNLAADVAFGDVVLEKGPSVASEIGAESTE